MPWSEYRPFKATPPLEKLWIVPFLLTLPSRRLSTVVSMSATMTSTVFIPDLTARTSSIMIPGANSDAEGSSRMVRFDNECILIPDRSKRPGMLSKSYSLPLWKKKHSHTSDSDTEVVSPTLGAADDARVMLKVPIPRYVEENQNNSARTYLASQDSYLNPRDPPVGAEALLLLRQRLSPSHHA